MSALIIKGPLGALKVGNRCPIHRLRLRIANPIAEQGNLVAMDRHRRVLVVIYAGAAAALIPWIAYLWVAEPARGLAHDVGWLTAGLVIVLAASAGATGVLCATGSPQTMVAASFSGSLAFATLWFHLTSPVGRESAFATGRSFIVLLLPLVLLAWTLATGLNRTLTMVSRRWGLAASYWVSAILLLLGALRLATVAPSTEMEHHIRLIWTGLDTFELVALAATAWCIHARSRMVLLASTFTAGLLTADAWTNVASTTGGARTAAIGMAVTEISLGALSLAVAATFGTAGNQARVGGPGTNSARAGK